MIINYNCCIKLVPPVIYNINSLVFITEVESVYSAVRTGSLYKTDTFCFYNRGGECLQRGTDWVLI